MKAIFKFVNRNKILTLFLVISTLIVIKLSNIQFFNFVPNQFRFFLKRPVETSNTFELLKLLENISLAYIASFIFFIVVDYIPKEKLELKSYKIIEESLISLYLYMSEIISIINFYIEFKEDIYDLSIAEVEQLNTKYFDNDIKYAKKTTLIDGIDKGSCGNAFYLKEQLTLYSKLIKKKVNEIKNMSCFGNIGFELVENIASLESNNFLSQAINLENHKNGIKIDEGNFNKNYLKFVQSYLQFNRFDFKKISFRQDLMNGLEKEEFIKKNNENRDKITP